MSDSTPTPGAFGGPAAGAPELNRIVDALQQMVRLQGATYQQLGGGIAILNSLPVYLVAALPVSAVGTMAFASDARNGAEGAGLGTGAIVVVNRLGVWSIVGTGAVPTV